MTRRKYRSQAGIILDILEALQGNGPMRPTRLTLYANLPYNRLREALARMEDMGLVEVDSDGYIHITRRGLEALERLREARRLLEALGYKL